MVVCTVMTCGQDVLSVFNTSLAAAMPLWPLLDETGAEPVSLRLCAVIVYCL